MVLQVVKMTNNHKLLGMKRTPKLDGFKRILLRPPKQEDWRLLRYQRSLHKNEKVLRDLLLHEDNNLEWLAVSEQTSKHLNYRYRGKEARLIFVEQIGRFKYDGKFVSHRPSIVIPSEVASLGLFTSTSSFSEGFEELCSFRLGVNDELMLIPNVSSGLKSYLPVEGFVWVDPRVKIVTKNTVLGIKERRSVKTIGTVVNSLHRTTSELSKTTVYKNKIASHTVKVIASSSPDSLYMETMKLSTTKQIALQNNYNKVKEFLHGRLNSTYLKANPRDIRKIKVGDVVTVSSVITSHKPDSFSLGSSVVERLK